MALNEKLFMTKDITCPVCHKPFVRYMLKKKQFTLDKRDTDYRPTYLGGINPRHFQVCVCPNCFFAADDKYFCPEMSEEERRKKEQMDSHRSQWDAANRVRAASTGQQIWKDLEADKLRTLSKGYASILRQISPLLQKVVSAIVAKGKPYNELQRDGDLEAAIRSWELAAICMKARRANHRLLGYTYLNAAWTARDAYEVTEDEELKSHYKAYEMAYLTEAVSFLEVANKATSIEDAFLPDGTKIQKENIPQSRVFEIMYILAGVHRMLGNMDQSNFYLEQIIYGSQNAQGIVMWFVNQAKDIRQEISNAEKNAPPPEDDEEDEDDENDDEDEE